MRQCGSLVIYHYRDGTLILQILIDPLVGKFATIGVLRCNFIRGRLSCGRLLYLLGSASTVWIGEEIGSLFPQPVRTPTASKIAASTFFFMNASFHLFVLSGLSTGTLKYIVSLKSYVCPQKILKIFLRLQLFPAAFPDINAAVSMYG